MKIKLFKLLFFILFLGNTSSVFSQITIKGFVIDRLSNKPLSNVNVKIVNITKGTTTDETGYFELNAKTQKITLNISFIGYESKSISINTTTNNAIINLKNSYLNQIEQNLEEITISNINSFVEERKTPVAATTFKALYIHKNIGVKDLPELLNTSPSIYTTKNGGAYGDASLNVRGFDQNNVAVLINNIPINDMETGWVYWSNWLNLPEVTSAVQIQRGLGASKLAIPSVGGTINILTNSSKLKKGGLLSYQYSSENSHKKTIGYNTGLLKNGWSSAVLLGHFNGNGFVDETQAEAYSYFINLGYKKNNHTFQFTAIGAPQWHNQHNNASTLKDYLKYSNTKDPNIKYNSEWGFLNNKTFTWSKNYFHKPIFSLNWNWKINSQTRLSTAFYSVFGKGGGTAPIGAINYNYPNSAIFKDENGQVNFDAIQQWNAGQAVSGFGQDNIPNSQGDYINGLNNGLSRYTFINNHAWYGTLLNLKQNINNNLRLDVGFDGRITSGKNALAVNNTLGADAYLDNFDYNNSNRIIYPSDYLEVKPYWNVFKSIDNINKIVFFNQSKIRWFSLFSQLEYTKDKFTSFVQVGISKQQLQRIDYFNLPRDVTGDGIPEPQKSKWKSLYGGNIKIGANYNINKQHTIFINTGYYSKQPLFDAVFSNYNDNQITADLTSEKIKSLELGYGLKTTNFKLKLNTYYTSWKDRYATITSFINTENVSGRLYGLQEIHKGVELESHLKRGKFSADLMASIGNWYYKGNVNNVKLYNNIQQEVATKNFYLEDVKVGDAPQFTASYTVHYKPFKSFEININQLFVDKLYAKIDVANFSNPNHQGSLQLPRYNVVNTGVNYSIWIPKIAKINFNFLVNNLFDSIYISKSDTNYFPENNQANWKGVNTNNRVFFAWGRTYSLGVKFEF